MFEKTKVGPISRLRIWRLNIWRLGNKYHIRWAKQGEGNVLVLPSGGGTAKIGF
jgi:hypothetical protein